MSNMPTIKEVADSIVFRLSQHGVRVQRYEAYSTNSIYLKFDFGMANSLRISDHKGKQNLQYMFNMSTNHKSGVKINRDNYTKYHYGFNASHFELLIKRIMEHRKKRIKNAGSFENYQFEMTKKYRENKSKKGFWSQSKIVS